LFQQIQTGISGVVWIHSRAVLRIVIYWNQKNSSPLCGGRIWKNIV